MSGESVEHYKNHGSWTNPGQFDLLIKPLPDDVEALAHVVQNLFIHSDYISLYGLEDEDFLSSSRGTLSIESRLKNIVATNKSPLEVNRCPQERTFTTCRDYALMLCSFLREKDYSARVRCGFATYFEDNKYEDHWVCEYWNAKSKCWCIADAQLDGEHCAYLLIDFNTVDIPLDKFLLSGYAWKQYRSASVEASIFGHGDSTGPMFLVINLVRDYLALRNQEASIWDTWRDLLPFEERLDSTILTCCDNLADVILNVDIEFKNLILAQENIDAMYELIWK
ncbi:MAG: transglutaminase [Rhodospirillales bacterium]|jgi:hypothetical protein|nr:transglutaminase [Rhodospirillales bacterium]